ncbi:MAG TPA: FkbM family methyltransferase [Rubrivivax sp.]|nr:FkbM family methyltransferase [Burkholderiales bacterium]HNU11809.1 FkbM family methyltransferase [Rubrivivax sp.]
MMRTIQRDGFVVQVDDRDSLGLSGEAEFEPEVRDALLRLARPGDTVVDIGANIGWFTLHLARRVGPAGVIHAFEPEPANLRLLEANVRANGLSWVVIHPVALGEAPGEALLHTTAYNTGMHRLYDSVCCDGPAIPVAVQRLDDLLAPGQVALVKIDVEGYEHAVLRGARVLLSTPPQPRVVSEYCPASMLEAGQSPSAFLNDMKAWGLAPRALDGAPIDWAELMADALRYEAYGRERFVAACAGANNPEILAIVAGLAAELGCRRPVIENLLFAAP